jgi:hypothetical protein
LRGPGARCLAAGVPQAPRDNIHKNHKNPFP